MPAETANQARARMAEDKHNMLESKVQVLTHRVDVVEETLSKETQRSINADTDLKVVIAELHSAMLALTNKNHIAEFVADNWKYIVLWVAVTAGSDVGKLIEVLKQIQ